MARAVGFGCKVIAANRSPITHKGDVTEIYPLAELDRLLSQSDVVVIAAGLGPEINARRLALKPMALLINIGRAAIVDEEALYQVLSSNRLGGAALEWWQHWTPEDPDRRPSRYPFHELSNVLMTRTAQDSRRVRLSGARAILQPTSTGSPEAKTCTISC